MHNVQCVNYEPFPPFPCLNTKLINCCYMRQKWDLLI